MKQEFCSVEGDTGWFVGDDKTHGWMKLDSFQFRPAGIFAFSPRIEGGYRHGNTAWPDP